MKSIIVFLTFKNSLNTWKKSGILDRELKYYELLAKKGLQITIFSYGDKSDHQIIKEKNNNINLKTLFLHRKINNSFFVFLFSLFYIYKNKNFFQNFDIFKSNQNYGSWLPLLCNFFFRKKFISRCGYDLFHFAILEKKYFKAILSYIICLFAYQFSNLVFVPTNYYKNFLIKYYFLNPKKIEILPNFVDRKIFKKNNNIKRYSNRILFIGRFEKQKNILNLLNLFKDSKYTLDILGNGSLKKEVNNSIYNSKVNIINNRIENKLLPDLINKYNYFILISHYEGNPKVLLEAMSCGLCPITSDVVGINNIINHKINGLKFKLKYLNNALPLIEKLKRKEIINIQKNAQIYIQENHDLNKVCDIEFYNIQKIIK